MNADEWMAHRVSLRHVLTWPCVRRGVIEANEVKCCEWRSHAAHAVIHSSVTFTEAWRPFFTKCGGGIAAKICGPENTTRRQKWNNRSAMDRSNDAMHQRLGSRRDDRLRTRESYVYVEWASLTHAAVTYIASIAFCTRGSNSATDVRRIRRRWHRFLEHAFRSENPTDVYRTWHMRTPADQWP